jgi:hypothetical protein
MMMQILSGSVGVNEIRARREGRKLLEEERRCEDGDFVTGLHVRMIGSERCV